MDDKHIQSAISRRYLGRVVIQLTAWLAVIGLGILVGLVVASQRVWQPYETLYQLLKLVRDYLPLIVLVLWLGGMLVILVLQWRRVAKSFISLTGTIQAMSQNDKADISLPEDLREIQGILQGVQAENQQNRMLAAEAEQRKNDLVVYLAHDLKTPLTSVLGYLTLLRDEKDISPELRQKYLDIATGKAMRLEDLINEFFEITRFSLKGLVLEPSQLDLSRMLEQLASEFEPLLAPKHLACHTEIEPGLSLTADPGKLERVFDNLLRNAVSYSYPNSELLLVACRENNQLLVRIRNHGDTIPQHQLEHIFEQFYRVGGARATEEGGAGLGLAIAREIVELHQGSITVTSANNLIDFEVRLPLEMLVKPTVVTTTNLATGSIYARLQERQ